MIASVASFALVLAVVPAPSFDFAGPPPVQAPAAPTPAAPTEVAPPPASPPATPPPTEVAPPPASPPATPPPTSGGPPALPPVAGETVAPPTSGGPPVLPPAGGENVAPPPEPAAIQPVDGPVPPTEPAPPQPGEVAGPPPSDGAPPATLPPEVVAEVIAAQPRAAVPAPQRAGRGMLIAAGIVGGIGGVIKVGSTVAAIREGSVGLGFPTDVIFTGAIFYSPMFAVALGLAGGGMAQRGRVDAHHELFDNTPATRRRRKKLGWGLFGAGMGVWALTRLVVVGDACSEQTCQATVLELGYYSSLAGTIPGVIMGGYGSGFDAYTRRFGHMARVSVSPMVRRGMQGLSVSGRF